MKRVAIIISLLFVSFFYTVAYAQECNVIVIPQSIIEKTTNNSLGNTKLDEILTTKIVKYLKNYDNVYPPSVNLLKTTAQTSLDFSLEENGPVENAKILSTKLESSKIVLISTRLEIQNAHQQKLFWHKLELPALTNLQSNLCIITDISILNIDAGATLWKNTYYKNINVIGDGINNYNTNNSKLNAINIYYDELAQKFVNDAIQNKRLFTTQTIKRKTIKTKKINNIKPNLQFKENVKPQKTKSNFFNIFKLKTDSVQSEEFKNKLDSKPVVTPGERHVIKDMTPKTLDNVKPKTQQRNFNRAIDLNTDVNTPNNYIQIKPRNKSNDYKPNFNTSVYEI